MSGSSPFVRSVGFATVSLALLCAAGAWEGWDRAGSRVAGVGQRLKTAELNRVDATQLQRGYYENLMGAGRFNSQLFQLYTGQPPIERFDESPAARQRDDFLDVEMVPDVRTAFHGKSFTTNEWGFRGRSYDRDPPAGTFRIAVLGASITMGWGVADGEPFSDRLEHRLNADAAAALRFRSFEVLNFAVAGYSPPQQLLQLRRALSFRPHAVLVVAHEVEIDRGITRLAAARERGIAIPLDSLQRAADRAWEGVTTRQAAERRLQPHRYELLEWIYRQMVEQTVAQGALTVWLFLPALDHLPEPSEIDRLAALAERAGMTVVDLRHVYDGVDSRHLRVSAADRHPNAQGHDRVAAALDRALRALPELQPYLPPMSGAPSP
jgi:hypothetical protein